MRNHTKLLSGGICAISVVWSSLALAETPVGFAGAFSGEYAQPDCSGCGDIDSWGLNGSGAFGLGTNNLAGQIDAGYHNVSSGGADVDLWNVGGKVFWSGMMSRIGVSLDYVSLDASGVDGDVTSYGAFGEYYASDAITLRLKGGGLSVSGSVAGLTASENGGYVGGAIVGYIVPNFALAGTVDHADVSGLHLTTYGVSAEYLFSEAMPISVYAGYGNSELSGGAGDIDEFFIGVKFYTNTNGTTLVDRHRNGSVGAVGFGNGLRLAF